MAHNPELLEQKGTIVQVMMCKAVLEFHHQGQKNRGLLFSNHLLDKDGKMLALHTLIKDHIKLGDKLTFDAHPLDSKGKDNCNWYVTSAWKSDMATGVSNEVRKLTTVNQNSIKNGRIYEILSPRKGILSFERENGREALVLFLASKVWIFGKRFSVKQHLSTYFSENDPVQFEAYPCSPDEHEGCTWFASLVWKGSRPLEVPSSFTKSDEMEEELDNGESEPQAMVTLQDNKNAKMARIAAVISDKQLILFWQVRDNQWETVLVNREVINIFGESLEDVDLRTFFKTRNVLKFLPMPSPPNIPTRHVAKKAWFDGLP